MNKKIFYTLSLSLLLNTFFVGYMVAGHFISKNIANTFLMPTSRGFPPTNPETIIMEEFEGRVADLSPEGQKIVFEAISEQRKKQTKDGNVIYLFLDIRKILLADDFNMEKLKGMHKKLDERARTSIAIIGDLISTIASKLSDEDRKIFFNKIGPLK